MPTLSPQTTPYYGGGQVLHPADTILTTGAPSTANIAHHLGTLAIDNAAGTIYGLASKSGGVATWAVLGGGSGAVASLTGGTGGAISPSGGNITLAGTANQITTTGSGSTITFSIPSAFTAPGSITAAAGAITATNGNLVASTAGTGLLLNPGTVSGTSSATLNARAGQVTITTPTINAGATFSFALTNSAVTASSTQILYGLTGGTTGAAITIQSVTNSASTSTVVVQNASAVTNSTGSLVLTFLVLN